MHNNCLWIDFRFKIIIICKEKYHTTLITKRSINRLQKIL